MATAKTIIKITKEQATNIDKRDELNRQFAEKKLVTKKFTIGAVGVVGCDFNFASANNTTAQPIDLGGIIPAYARIIDVVAITSTTFAGTGISAFGVTIGTSSGGTEIITSANLITAAAINQCAVGAGYTLIAITAAAKHIFIGGAPTGGNWSALLAGKLTIYVTFLDTVAA